MANNESSIFNYIKLFGGNYFMGKNIKLTTAILAVFLTFVGCGNVRSDVAHDTIGTNFSNNDSFAVSKSIDVDSSNTAAPDYQADIVKEKAMIARTASINVDVKNLEEFDKDLISKVDSYGGHVVSSEIEKYEYDYETSRYGRYSVKVPADKLDDFLNIVDGKGTITDRNISAEDVSLDYVDVDAHLNALKMEKDELSRLLEETQSVSEVIEVKEALTNVQSQLDSYEAQMKILKNRIAYSEVSITAHENRNVEHPLRKAFEINFKEELINGIESAVTILVGLITAIPAIAIITGFGISFVWILKKVIRKIFRKKNEKIKFKYMLVPVDYND